MLFKTVSIVLISIVIFGKLNSILKDKKVLNYNFDVSPYVMFTNIQN